MFPKRIVVSALVATAFVFAAAGCGGSPTIATVGKQKITKAQFDAKMTEALGSYAGNQAPGQPSQKAPKPGTAAYKTLKQQVAQYLAQASQRDQAAEKMGIRVTDKQVDARVAAIKAANFQGSEAKLEAALKKAQVSVSQMRDDVRQQLIDGQLKTRLTKNISVSGADVQAFYKKNRAMFQQPSTRDVRHILVKTQKQAADLYAQLQKGADFAALAKKYSTDPSSAQQGGKLTVGKGQTVPAFDKVAFSLPTGQVSPPVHSRYGWHIIQALSAVRSAGVVPFSKAASQIRAQLMQSKQSSVLSAWMQKTAKQFPIVYAKGYAPTPPPAAPAPAPAPGK